MPTWSDPSSKGGGSLDLLRPASVAPTTAPWRGGTVQPAIPPARNAQQPTGRPSQPPKRKRSSPKDAEKALRRARAAL